MPDHLTSLDHRCSRVCLWPLRNWELFLLFTFELRVRIHFFNVINLYTQSSKMFSVKIWHKKYSQCLYFVSFTTNNNTRSVRTICFQLCNLFWCSQRIFFGSNYFSAVYKIYVRVKTFLKLFPVVGDLKFLLLFKSFQHPKLLLSRLDL